MVRGPLEIASWPPVWNPGSRASCLIYLFHDFQPNEVHDFMVELVQEVKCRLEKAGVLGKCITLKMKIRAQGAPKETAKFMGECDSLYVLFNLKKVH